MSSRINMLARTSVLIGLLSLGASAAEHSEHYIIHLTNSLTNTDINSVAALHGTLAVLDTGIDSLQPVLAGSLTSGWDFVHNAPGGREVADINQETTPILDQETTPILDQETTPILDGGSAIILTQETTPILDQETTPILDGKKFPAYGHGTMVAGLIHLVAPDAKIMPIRALGADGHSTTSKLAPASH